MGRLTCFGKSLRVQKVKSFQGKVAESMIGGELLWKLRFWLYVQPIHQLTLLCLEIETRLTKVSQIFYF